MNKVSGEWLMNDASKLRRLLMKLMVCLCIKQQSTHSNGSYHVNQLIRYNSHWFHFAYDFVYRISVQACVSGCYANYAAAVYELCVFDYTSMIVVASVVQQKLIHCWKRIRSSRNVCFVCDTSSKQ